MTRTFSLSGDSEKLRLPGRRRQCDRSIVPNVSLSIACFDVRNHSLLSESRRSLWWRNDRLVITSNRSVTSSLLQFKLLLVPPETYARNYHLTNPPKYLCNNDLNNVIKHVQVFNFNDRPRLESLRKTHE